MNIRLQCNMVMEAYHARNQAPDFNTTCYLQPYCFCCIDTCRGIDNCGSFAVGFRLFLNFSHFFFREIYLIICNFWFRTSFIIADWESFVSLSPISIVQIIFSLPPKRALVHTLSQLYTLISYIHIHNLPLFFFFSSKGIL